MALPSFRKIISVLKHPPRDLEIDRRQMAGSHAGPPAIAFARRLFAGRRDILIDPLETEFAADDKGIAVRAWIFVPTADMPEAVWQSIAETSAKFADLPPQTRQIFFLATSYRLSIDRVSKILALSKRDVRRQLLRAIAKLDGRSL